jgi:hypothetical protein
MRATEVRKFERGLTVFVHESFDGRLRSGGHRATAKYVQAHVQTSDCYPPSKREDRSVHKTIEGDALRITPPAFPEETRPVVERFVAHDSTRRWVHVGAAQCDGIGHEERDCVSVQQPHSWRRLCT